MVEATNELSLEVPRRIQSDVTDLKTEVREPRMRMGHMETRMAHLHPQVAEISVRMDRRDDPMERIMRRLELTEQPH
jgi:hypothetical protein